MTMYELTEQYSDLLERYYAAETDEDAAAALDMMTAVGESIKEKAENYAKMIRNVDGEIDALKKEEKRLAAMRKAREAMVERLKGNMLSMMDATGTVKLETGCGNWTTQNNPWSCTVTDAERVPERFKTYRTECDIDKKAMIAEFKATGELLEGCVIEQRRGVRFK